MDHKQLQLIPWEFIGGLGVSRSAAPIPSAAPNIFKTAPGRRSVSWLGHSTILLEIDGYFVLTDPVWSDRCSPSDVVRSHRLHPSLIQLEVLSTVDVVIISYDHYGPSRYRHCCRVCSHSSGPVFVPIGVGAHLRPWSIPGHRIVELDWDQSARVDELTLICVPARHFSGTLPEPKHHAVSVVGVDRSKSSRMFWR